MSEAREIKEKGERLHEPGRVPRAERKWRALLFLVFLGSLLVRSAYLLEISDHVFFRQLVVDSRAYDQWARRILEGEWLGSKAFYQDPLYPYFLAFLYWIFGRRLVAVYLAQAFLSSLSVFPMFGLGRRIFEDPRAGFLASLFWAFYKVSFFFDGQVLKTSPGLALLIFVLWAVVRTGQEGGALQGFLTGLGLGLLCLYRGNFLAVVPLLAGWAIWREARERLPGRVSSSVLLVSGLVLVLGLSAFRNRMVSGEWVLTTTQGGVNFYVGNFRGNKWGVGKDPDFARRVPRFEQDDFTREAERRTGRKLTPKQVDRFWYREGLREIKADPRLFLVRLFRKGLVLLNRHEVSDNLNYDFFAERISLILRLPLPAFWLAGPFGLAGALLALLRRRGGALFLYLGSYSATLFAFYIVARYRMPMVPALLLFAGYGLASAWDGAKKRDWKSISVYAAALLVFSAVSYPRLQPPSFARSWQKMGGAYLEEGRWSEAITCYEKALELNPESAQAWLGLGIALLERARVSEAIHAFQNAAALDPDYAPAHYLLAAALERAERFLDARKEYEKALQLDPELDEAREALARLKAGSGSTTSPAR